jgi:hypothetical protein
LGEDYGEGCMSHDAVTKEKAKEMYVTNGLTLSSISCFLPQIPKETLRWWCYVNNWPKQRRERVIRTEERRERIERTLDRVLVALETKFDPKIVCSINKLIDALKSTPTFEFNELSMQHLDKRKKGLTPETLKEIEEKLGLFDYPEDNSED